MPNGLTKNAEATAVEMLPGIFRRTLNEGAHTMLCELHMAAGSTVPAHTHPPPQIGYLASGRFRFRLGDEEVDGSAGTFVLVPRGTIHAFWNPHDEPATMLSIVSPPVLEGSFEAFVIYCSPGRRVRSTWMRSRPTIAASALSSHVAAMKWR